MSDAKQRDAWEVAPACGAVNIVTNDGCVFAFIYQTGTSFSAYCITGDCDDFKTKDEAIAFVKGEI